MARKRVSYAAIGTAFLAGTVALYLYLSKPKSPSKDSPNWGKIVVVVTALDNYQNLLSSHPDLVLVGTKNVNLRPNVAEGDRFRVFETETDDGWVHVTKHLRPDTVILSSGLDERNIGRFSRRVLQMEDAWDKL